MKYFYFFTSNKIKLLSLSVLLMSGIVTFSNQTAHAATDPAQFDSLAPRYVGESIAEGCDVFKYDAFSTEWLSPVGDPTKNETQVPMGSTRIDLQLNWITYRCTATRFQNDIVLTSNIVDNATTTDAGTSIFGLAGTISDSVLSPPGTTEARSGVVKQFYLQGNYNTTKNITISKLSRSTFTVSSNASNCLSIRGSLSPPTSGKWDFGPIAYPGYCTQYNSNFTLRIIATTNITGRVFSMLPDGSRTGVSGATLDTCGNGNISTNANGDYSFTLVKGTPFCARVIAGQPVLSNGAYARPLTSGYPGVTPGCPDGFGGSNSSPLVNGNNYCVQASYECQVAGEYVLSTSCAGGNITDRTVDAGYDIVYTPIVVPPPLPPPPPPPPHTYFEVNGSDVAAGASFATGSGATEVVCSVAPKVGEAGIVGWNNNTPPGYTGAGGQYAAFAMGQIQEFVTNQGNGKTSNGEPNGLTFANRAESPGLPDVNLPSGMFGGMSGDAPCVDYWKDRPGAVTALPSGPVSGWPDGNYYTTSDVNLGAANIPDGKNISLFVEGNVAISGDLTYASATTTWANRNLIPSFKLIVHGSIFIGAGVGQLDGIYAAIPTTGESNKNNQFSAPNAGTITTCSQSAFTSYDPNLALSNGMSVACSNKPLVFNGSVSAQQLWLLRSYGGIATGQPAEVFNYQPEIWLKPKGTKSYAPQYQSIIGLPPVL